MVIVVPLKCHRLQKLGELLPPQLQELTARINTVGNENTNSKLVKFRQIDTNVILLLKGTATLIISIFSKNVLFKPWTLIQVSSKSVEKWGSY